MLEEKISEILKKRKLTVSVAESCTGGLLSSRLTDISGSSEFIKLNAVTYSNESKVEFLCIPEEIIKYHGAVSSEVAFLMAQGIKKLAKTDFGVGITGIAGPTGGTVQKPVGLVYIGIYGDYPNHHSSKVIKFNAPQGLNRIETKKIFCEKALETLLVFLQF